MSLPSLAQMQGLNLVADQNIKGIAEGLTQLFAPFCEVIVHDITSSVVVNVFGTQTGREVGEPSFLEELGIRDWAENVHGPYRKTAPDGRSIKSISIVTRHPDGSPHELVCINIDVSQFETARALLAGLTSVPEAEAMNPLANDWLEGLHVYVANWSVEKGIQMKDLQPAMRMGLIFELDQQGVFKQKNAAEAVAKALGVSRATVYQDLRKLSST